MQREKNNEALNTGKHNAGERGRRSDTEHFERHAAWGRDFFQKTIPTLHGSGDASDAPRMPHGDASDAPRMPQGRPRPLPPDPQTTKREPFARRAFGKNVENVCENI